MILSGWGFAQVAVAIAVVSRINRRLSIVSAYLVLQVFYMLAYNVGTSYPAGLYEEHKKWRARQERTQYQQIHATNDLSVKQN